MYHLPPPKIRRAIVVRLALILCAAACAEPASPEPRAAPQRPARAAGADAGPAVPDVRVAFENDQLTITDARTGAAIIEPSGTPIWSRFGKGGHDLKPRIDVRPAPGGADVVLTYTNRTDAPKRLGQIAIGGVNLEAPITRIRADLDAHPVPVQVPEKLGKPFRTSARVYPRQLYAPVEVLAGARYTIGVAVHYPVLEYAHAVELTALVPGGRWGRGWRISIVPNARDDRRPEGDVPPGATRTYTISVRLLENARGDDWLQTLAPYRDAFRDRYGPIDYTKDPRPVYGAALAQVRAIRPDNPGGYIDAANRRPDRFGWAPWVNHLESVRGLGFERFMLVAPSGLFREHDELNFPFQFTSGWRDQPKMASTLPELAAFGARGGLGLWWGRSHQVMDDWDDGELEPFDPANPRHAARVIEELDGAVRAGADTIGLDSFTAMPPWDAWRFLDLAHDKFPDLRFVIEPTGPDVLHNRAAMYMWVTRPPSRSAFQVKGRHVLADFLNPGHETWGRIDAGAIRALEGLPRGRPTPPELVDQWARRAAEMGYVPVIHFAARVGPRHHAK